MKKNIWTKFQVFYGDMNVYDFFYLLLPRLCPHVAPPTVSDHTWCPNQSKPQEAIWLVNWLKKFKLCVCSQIYQHAFQNFTHLCVWFLIAAEMLKLFLKAVTDHM